jgi:protease secretion system outer membrane protein
MTMLQHLLVRSVLLLAPMGAAHAAGGELLDSYEQAKRFDPLFQSALAEREANKVAANVARVAYLPQLRFTIAQTETDNRTRRTLSLTQPIIDADRYATLQQAEPRDILADATYQFREQELASRLFNAVSEVILARESLALNQAKIDAIAQQAKSAKRAFDLGTGTITDFRDAQVQLEQANASDATLRARKNAAERALAAVTGSSPGSEAFNIAWQTPTALRYSLDDYIKRFTQTNPQIVQARQNERLTKLELKRARGALLPTLSAVASRSDFNGSSSHYVGLAVSLPLEVGTCLQVSGAAASASQAGEQARDVEQQTRLEVERLLEFVEAGRNEVEIRIESIRSAELSVEANEKSFEGGIRNKLDVINAIQTLYQTKEDYDRSEHSLAGNLLH